MNYTEKYLTDWFPSHIKPARPGVYSVVGGDYAHWNGERWGCWADNIEEAIAEPFYKDAYQHKRWRGLNYNPGG